MQREERIMSSYHIAQVNIARMKAPLDDSIMAGFVARLDEINALADKSPGFVWRLQTDAGNATYLRPYGDERILFPADENYIKAFDWSIFKPCPTPAG
jgi:hypothetical protein